MNRKVLSWAALATAGLGVVTLVCVHWAGKSPRATVSTADELSRTAGGRDVASSPGAGLAQKPSGQKPAKAKADQYPSPEALEQATAQARNLVTDLAQLDVSKGVISAEDAVKWKQTLDELTRLGVAAVPAIREFLQKNEDMDFRVISGGIQLGQPSIRTALICALQDIGGPDARELMADTMKVTAIPTEIAMLANFLEQQAPGQYRDQAVSAGSEALAMAAQGQLPGMDIGPLLEVMRGLDGPSTGATAEKLAVEYKVYAAISLAGLQNGSGLPGLLRMVQDPEDGAQNQLAYQMLAQASAQSPEASTALLELARKGQIPDFAWAKIALGLGGDQYGMFGFSAEGKPDVPNVPGLTTYHVESGNQNFYSLPASLLCTPEQVEQRRGLIDQLLATKPGPDAVQALQQARAWLSGTVAQK
jgi:hypothetical protein